MLKLPVLPFLKLRGSRRLNCWSICLNCYCWGARTIFLAKSS
uniref:Dihydroorotase isoform X2 n=1 Tax=Rhizophora mucronata TaxID=61149 RepID=A0A2P2KGP3_RHIMU